MSTSKKNQTAFPAFPMVDNLQKIFTPFGGQTFYEYVLLMFACNLCRILDTADEVMHVAKELTDAYFVELDKEKPDSEKTLTIIK